MKPLAYLEAVFGEGVEYFVKVKTFSWDELFETKNFVQFGLPTDMKIFPLHVFVTVIHLGVGRCPSYPVYMPLVEKFHQKF